MSIFPLPVFEEDADPSRRDAMTDEEIYARLQPPSSIVVRFGAMKLVGEFPYEGDARPGCGSKLVARTVRGTEIAEMLTTTCSNSGCGKSISRKEMLDYIERSGGKDYPFHEHGRILRVATIEDLNTWSQIQARKPEMLRQARAICAAAGLPLKVVEVEPIFGGETTTVFYLSEDRIDFRDVIRTLAAEFKSRIEMRQVGARDEARLVADYERCGQHCCCKSFLKVLKPVSMRSAKVQKATLDPLKISGRCGRLMCCLRYEDETYTALKARLPRLKSRVGTVEGPGIVIDTKILVQLALVRLEESGREIAVPVEELCDPDAIPPRPATEEGDPLRGMSTEEVTRRTTRHDRRGRGETGASTSSPGSGGQPRGPRDRARDQRDRRERGADQRDQGRRDAPVAGESMPKARTEERVDAPADADPTAPGTTPGESGGESEAGSRKRRSRRRRGRGAGKGDASTGAVEGAARQVGMGGSAGDGVEGGGRDEASARRQEAFRERSRRIEAGEKDPGPRAGGDGEPQGGPAGAESAGQQGAPGKKRRRRRGRRRGKGGNERRTDTPPQSGDS